MLIGLLLFAGCQTTGQPAAQSQSQDQPALPTQAFPVPPAPSDSLPVVADPTPNGSWAHNPEDFTQGLVFADGALFESTGRNGESKVRRLNASSGEVELTQELPPQHFGEGLASFEGSLYQLTWRSGVCLIYDRATLKPQRELFYTSEGWGLTVSPQEKLLVFSDGSAELRFLDPDNLIVKRRLTVTDGAGQAVFNLNELEWVRGEIWANIWLTDRIARIDPATGKVLGWLLFTKLMAEHHQETEDVLNGIAYDATSDTLWVTGKLWPRVYRFDDVGQRFFAPKSSP
jgi:glutamine cyclotransferase